MLETTIARLSKITDTQRESMFVLHNRYFSNVRREKFYRDMDEKDWAIILRDGGEIVGFSTLQIIRLRVGGAERIFLFSGDTIVDCAHWRDSTLAGSFAHFMLKLIHDFPETPRYWFLISKGYRTYRFLPVFFHEYHPNPTCAAPDDYDRLLNSIALHKFGTAFDAHTGLVKLNGSADRLRPEMCAVPPGRERDPHVNFFLERNPSYRDGDELACLAAISRENLNARAWRVLEHTRVTWDE